MELRSHIKEVFGLSTLKIKLTNWVVILVGMSVLTPSFASKFNQSRSANKNQSANKAKNKPQLLARRAPQVAPQAAAEARPVNPGAGSDESLQVSRPRLDPVHQPPLF